ncbi:MAG: PmoA family protein [Bacteroidales bacterium]|nr:PmoA family protein [Bacteroidales bacterium]
MRTNLLWILMLSGLSLYGQDVSITFDSHEADRRIDVLYDGKLFTSYIWPENVYKPVLYPVCTYSGTEITRGFPLRPREGERNDHIHQVGIWLNYGKVNGLDFWGNGYRGFREPGGGEIKHRKIESLAAGTSVASLETSESWLDPEGRSLLEEKTGYYFRAQGRLRIIDRITTLTATDTTVVFSDTKEGMFGIRVARQLELPLNENVTLLDASGKPSQQKVNAAAGATGNYRSSEGVTGEAVWGTRARWMNLYGIIGNEKISLAVCDHPKNQGYPTYWHARGYGLFAANPLGWSDFTKGKQTMNFTLKPGESVTFRYRVIVSSGSHLTDTEINDLLKDFSGRY